MAMTTPLLQVHGVSKTFVEKTRELPTLRNVSISVRQGEFVSIIGPSGCGKSTLLGVIAGLIPPDEGRVLLNSAVVTGQVGLAGYMPQKDLLVPWRTVLDNVILAQEIAGVPRAEARAKARPLLEEFGLDPFASAHPHTLSGGMRQRAAFLRTVLFEKELLLLDEPFGALDSLTRSAMHQWLLSLWERLGKTVVLVTHDMDEALLLSDRIYVMTPLPGQVRSELAVTLPRPRRYDLVLTQDFIARKAALLAALRDGAALAGAA